jgi:hypothetical protein
MDEFDLMLKEYEDGLSSWQKLCSNIIYSKPIRFFKEVYSFFRYKIPRGFINLIIWFPVIWNDRDFDHWYFFEIIRRKLERMIHHHEKYQVFVGVEKEIKYMKICKNLIKRIQDDDYMFSGRYKDLTKLLPYSDNKPAFEWLKKYMQQDMDLLFKLLKKHVMKWWD